MDKALKDIALNIDKTSWTLVNFGDVVMEPKATMKNMVAEGIEHVVGLEHIDSEDIHLRRSAGIDQQTTFTKKFEKGDVLFGRRRAYLKKAAQATFSGICSGDITVFRAKSGLLPELLPFVVNNDIFFDYAVKHSAGGLSPRVKFKDIANYQFLLPPKPQQEQLAQLLWAMDEVIEREREVLEELKLLYERMLSDSFSCENKFDRITLGNLVVIKSGDAPSILNFSKEGGSIPYLKVNDLNESFKYQYYSKERVSPIKDKVIRVGSVIFPKRGAAIMTNKVRILSENSHIDTNIMALEVIDDKVLNNEFLYYFLYFKKLYKIADTSQIPQLNNVHINPFPISLPPIQIQKSIVSKLNLIIDNLKIIESKLTASQVLRMSLVNQIFG